MGDAFCCCLLAKVSGEGLAVRVAYHVKDPESVERCAGGQGITETVVDLSRCPALSDGRCMNALFADSVEFPEFGRCPRGAK